MTNEPLRSKCIYCNLSLYCDKCLLVFVVELFSCLFYLNCNLYGLVQQIGCQGLPFITVSHDVPSVLTLLWAVDESSSHWFRKRSYMESCSAEAVHKVPICSFLSRIQTQSLQMEAKWSVLLYQTFGRGTESVWQLLHDLQEEGVGEKLRLCWRRGCQWGLEGHRVTMVTGWVKLPCFDSFPEAYASCVCDSVSLLM